MPASGFRSLPGLWYNHLNQRTGASNIHPLHGPPFVGRASN